MISASSGTTSHAICSITSRLRRAIASYSGWAPGAAALATPWTSARRSAALGALGTSDGRGIFGAFAGIAAGGFAAAGGGAAGRGGAAAGIDGGVMRGAGPGMVGVGVKSLATIG